MSLADYLAKNYLSDSKKKSKKSKKEKKENKTDVIIQDNTPLGARVAELSNEDQNNGEVTTLTELPARMQTTKKKGWKVVGTDEVIQDVEREQQQEIEAEKRMSSGAKAGLQTADEVARQIKEKETAELQYLEANSAHTLGKNAQTVYRDATGKRIDMEKQRAEELEKQIQEEERKRAEHKKRNMGLVQLLDLEESRKNLAKAGSSNLARYADDNELNSELKNKEHDDDPLLSFNPKKSKKHVSRTGRKLFKGGYPENRFGIVPGWRWDGVDRSNGFEKAWFKKQGEIAERKTFSYTMQEEY